MNLLLKRIGWSGYLIWQMVGESRIPYAPPEEILRRRDRRVRSIVAFAARQVPFYREALQRLRLSPDRFQTADDLARLPVIDKSDLQRDPERFCSDWVRRSRHLELHSSGSTGLPKSCYWDYPALFQSASHGERERAALQPVTGRWRRRKETLVTPSVNSSHYKIQHFYRSAAWLPAALDVRRQYLLITDPVEKALEAIDQFQPDIICSYGSWFEMLAIQLIRKPRRWSRPKVIYYTSDSLSEMARQWYTRRQGVAVFSLYGAVEGLKLAFECEQHCGLHVNADLYHLSIRTGTEKPAAPGEIGEVFLSNLINRAMVLLNYRLGDLAQPLDGLCPCGRTLPRISIQLGRSDELLETGWGEIVHPLRFRSFLNKLPGILQFQVLQTAASEVQVLLVPAGDADRERIQHEVHQAVAREFGGRMAAGVRFVEELRTGPGAKAPVVVALRQPAPETPTAGSGVSGQENRR